MHADRMTYGDGCSLDEETDEVKAAVASAAATQALQTSHTSHSDRSVSALWIILVSSLSAAAIATAVLGGVYSLIRHTGPPDALITIFVSTLTALLGLFIDGPTRNS